MMENVGTMDVNTPVYNLKAVVKETALKPSTIRAWERRYGLPQPRRTTGGHRQYSQRDIDTLNWLVARQNEGMSISHAAQLWRSLNDQDVRWPGKPLPPKTSQPVKTAVLKDTSSKEIASLRDEWVSACMAFDRMAAEQALVSAFALYPPEIVAVQLLQAGLSQIGEMWYEGEVSIQQEHFASAMAVQRMDMLIAATAPPTRPQRLIIASVEDDFHIFGPLLFTFLFRRRGFDVLYLGADMPTASLKETVEQLKPAMLILSAQTLSTATALLDVTAALAGQETLIGYGGTIFTMMPQLQQHIPAHYLGPKIDGAVPVVERILRQDIANPVIGRDHKYSQGLKEYRQRRYLIESEIWRRYSASGKPTSHLSKMNQELAGIITSALIFEEGAILSREMAWPHYFSNSYDISEMEAQAYLNTYYQAAREHLGSTAQMVVDWLQDVSTN